MKPEFWNGIALLKRLYDQYLEPVADRHGIARIELDILLFLANNPGFDTAADIVRRRRLTKSHVSGAVHSLAAQGYLERSFDAGNRKSVHLRCRETAGGIIRDGQTAQRKFVNQIFLGFTREEKRETVRLFEKVVRNLQMED